MAIHRKGTLMISLPLLVMILFSVGSSAFAQLSLKHGMNNSIIQQMLATGDWLAIGHAVATNLFVLMGLVLYGLSATIWLFVLARLEVSVAYPFVALGFIVTMGLGCWFFGEALTLTKVAGTAFVTLGVYLVASG